MHMLLKEAFQPPLPSPSSKRLWSEQESSLLNIPAFLHLPHRFPGVICQLNGPYLSLLPRSLAFPLPEPGLPLPGPPPPSPSLGSEPLSLSSESLLALSIATPSNPSSIWRILGGVAAADACYITTNFNSFLRYEPAKRAMRDSVLTHRYWTRITTCFPSSFPRFSASAADSLLRRPRSSIRVTYSNLHFMTGKFSQADAPGKIFFPFECQRPHRQSIIQDRGWALSSQRSLFFSPPSLHKIHLPILDLPI